MKKATKIILCIAGAALVVGLGLCAAALIRVDFDPTRLSTGEEPVASLTDVVVNENGCINIENNTGDISISPYIGSTVRLEYYVSDYRSYELTGDENNFTFRSTYGERLWFEHIQLDFWQDKNDLTVYVPEDFCGELCLTTSTGSIYVNYLSELTALNATATTGDISVLGLMSTERVTLSTSTGSGAMVDCELPGGTIEATASTGLITLRNVALPGGTINCSNKTGGFRVDNVTADSITTSCSTGRTSLSGVDANTLSFTSTTGSITGSLCGEQSDYSIESSTNTGTNSLPAAQLNGVRILRVHASTGSINITFEGR